MSKASARSEQTGLHHAHDDPAVAIDVNLKNGMTVRITATGQRTSAAKPSSGIGLYNFSPFASGVSELLHTAERSDLSAETLGALLHEVADSVHRRQPQGGGLTQSDAEYLVLSGVLTGAQLEDAEQRVRDGALAQQERRTRLGSIVRTLTAEEVGQRLGISASRVRHRLNDHGLFAFKAGRSQRYPLWQFLPDSDQVLPKLAEVIPAFPGDWHPASVEGFMTTPQDDLRAGAEEPSLTPVEWLAGGGDPAAVVAILDRITRS